MSNELVVRKQQEMTFDEMTRAAKAMALSGYFNDASDVSQAMVKILAGAEMGIGPFGAMSNIHVIKGKPVLGANLIATLIKNDARYDYRIKRLDNEAAVIEFYEYDELVGESSFTLEEARTAGVGATTPPGKNKTMLQMYARNMLFSRAISNGAKWYTPGIFGGAAFYTPDEMGVEEDEDGGIIDVTPPPVDSDTGGIIEGETVEFDDLRSATEEDAPTNGSDPLQAARDSLTGKTSTLADIATAAVMTGLYNAQPHAFNAVKMYDWPDSDKFELVAEQKVKTATAREVLNWMITRKLDEEDAERETAAA